MELFNAKMGDNGTYQVREGTQAYNAMYADRNSTIKIIPVIIKGVNFNGFKLLLLINNDGFLYAVPVDKRKHLDNGAFSVFAREFENAKQLNVGTGTELVNAEIIDSVDYVYILTNHKQIVILKNGFIKEEYNINTGATYINKLTFDVKDATIVDSDINDFNYYKVKGLPSKVSGMATVNFRSEIGGIGKESKEYRLKDEAGVFLPSEYGDHPFIYKDNELQGEYVGYGFAYEDGYDSRIAIPKSLENTVDPTGKTYVWALSQAGDNTRFALSGSLNSVAIPLFVTGSSQTFTSYSVTNINPSTLPSSDDLGLGNDTTTPAPFYSAALGLNDLDSNGKVTGYIIVQHGVYPNTLNWDKFLFLDNTVGTELKMATITNIDLNYIAKDEKNITLVHTDSSLMNTGDDIPLDVLTVSDSYDRWHVTIEDMKLTPSTFDATTGAICNGSHGIAILSVLAAAGTYFELIPPFILYKTKNDKRTDLINTGKIFYNQYDLNIWDYETADLTWKFQDDKIVLDGSPYPNCVVIEPLINDVPEFTFLDEPVAIPEIKLDKTRVIGYNMSATSRTDRRRWVKYPVMISKPFTFGYELPATGKRKAPDFTGRPAFNGKFYFPVGASVVVTNRLLEWEEQNTFETNGIARAISFFGGGPVVFTSNGIFMLETGEKLSNYVIRDDGEFVYSKDANSVFFVSNENILKLYLQKTKEGMIPKIDNISNGVEELRTAIIFNIRFVEQTLYVATNKGVFEFVNGKWNFTDISASYIIDIDDDIFAYEYEIAYNDDWGKLTSPLIES